MVEDRAILPFTKRRRKAPTAPLGYTKEFAFARPDSEPIDQPEPLVTAPVLRAVSTRFVAELLELSGAIDADENIEHRNKGLRE